MSAPRQMGFTLTEVLLALGLVSLMTVGLFGWTTTTARAAAALSGPATWNATAEAALRAIHWDLFVADLGQPIETRVQAQGSSLRILTRSESAAGPIEHQYVLEHGTLIRKEVPPRGRTTHRLLVDQVTAWRCEVSSRERRWDVTLEGGPEGKTIHCSGAIR